MAVELGDGVGAARIERSLLALPRLLDQPEHLGGGSLVEAGLRRADAHGLQHVGDADGGDVGGEHRLTPGGRHEGLRREIVDFVGPRVLHDAQQAREIGEIAVMQRDTVRNAEPAQPMVLDAAMRGATDDARCRDARSDG